MPKRGRKKHRSREELIVSLLPTIKGLAYTYHVRGNYLVNYEDLVAEGCLLASDLVRLVNEKDFEYMFKSALRNRYISLVRKSFTKSRAAIVVDLTEALELINPHGMEELYMKEKIEHAMSMLDERAQRVLKELIDPSDELIALAEKEKKAGRRQKDGLISNGTIARFLGMARDQFAFALTDIRDAIMD